MGLTAQRTVPGNSTAAAWLWSAALWACVAGLAPGQEAAPGLAEVPQPVIQELNSLALPPEKAVAESVKRRQYRKVLRLGDEAVSKHPQAPNLPLVWSAMLDAAQGLVLLDRDEEARQRMFDLAGKLSASSAPPSVRMNADLTLTHARLAQVRRDPKEAALTIARFADLYDGTEAESRSLMCAIQMAFEQGTPQLYQAFRDRLAWEHADEPGVHAFLRNRFSMNPHQGRLLVGSLPRAGGGALRLPADMLGHHYLIAFWSAAMPDADFKLAPALEAQKAYGGRLKFVGVNLDATKFVFENYAGAHGLDWIHTFSGQGLRDPFLLRYGAPSLPYFLSIRADGRLHSDKLSGAGWFAWNLFLGRSLIYLRSGEFLVAPRADPRGETAAAPPPEGVPAGVWEALQGCFAVPPFRYHLAESESVRRCETALRLGADAEKKLGRMAPGIHRVREAMLAAALALDILEIERAPPARAQPIAERLLASAASKEEKLLADVCLTRAKLRDQFEAKVLDEEIRAFVERYRGSRREGEALACAAVLALEVAREQVQRESLAALRDKHAGNPRVRDALQAFLRQSDVGRLFQARLRGLKGEAWTCPEDFLGKVTVLFFFALPGQETQRNRERFLTPLQELSRWYAGQERGDVRMIGVSVDESLERVKAWAEREGWSWEIAWSGKGWQDPVAEAYGDPGAGTHPHLLILNAQGRITHDLRPSLSDWWGSWKHGAYLPNLSRAVEQLNAERGAEALAARRWADAETCLSRALGRTAGRQQAELLLGRARARAALNRAGEALQDLAQAACAAQAVSLAPANLEEGRALAARLEQDLAKQDGAAEERETAARLRAQLDLAHRQALDSKAEHVKSWNVIGPFDLAGSYVELVLSGISREELRLPFGTPPSSDMILSAPGQEGWRRRLPPEREIRFDARCPGKDGCAADWETLDADPNGYVNLGARYRPGEGGFVACALVYVHAPAAGAYRVSAGSDYHLSVRINGEELHAAIGFRAAAPNQDRFWAELDQGCNEVLVKAAGWCGKGGFYFRIVDPERRLKFALRPER